MVKQEVAVESNLLLHDFDEIQRIGVIDYGDFQYVIRCYVTSCFDYETGSDRRYDINIKQFLYKMV